MDLHFFLILSYLKLIHNDIMELRISSDEIIHTDLANGLSFILRHVPKIDNLRIYASTTGKILPAISVGNCHIKNCYIIIHMINDESNTNQMFNQRLMMLVDEWKELFNDGKIENLKIKNMSSNPLHYSIIVDDSYFLYGNYIPKEESTTKVVVKEPYIFTNACMELERIINKYTEWFDEIFNEIDSEL